MEENQENVKKKKSFKLSTLIIFSVVSILIGACIMFVLGITGVYSPTKVVASMKGKKYNYSDVENLLSDYLGDSANMKLSLLLDSVDYEILNKKITLSESEQAEIDRYVTSYVYYYGLSEDYARQYLTVAKLKDAYYLDYIGKNYVSDEEINDYYENTVIGDIPCEHILISADEDFSDEKALALAKEIIKKLNSGVSFEDVAEEYENTSDHIKHEEFTCSSIESSGSDKLLFSDLDSAFTEALLNLEDNTYSSVPVKSSFGYHIIYRKTQSERPTLDDNLKQKLSKVLAENYISNGTIDSNLYLDLLIDLRKENNFKLYDAQLKKAYDEYCNPSDTSYDDYYEDDTYTEDNAE